MDMQKIVWGAVRDAMLDEPLLPKASSLVLQRVTGRADDTIKTVKEDVVYQAALKVFMEAETDHFGSGHPQWAVDMVLRLDKERSDAASAKADEAAHRVHAGTNVYELVKEYTMIIEFADRARRDAACIPDQSA